MAEDNSVGAVYVELGLDISKLESDFIAVDETIQQNLNRLNRERNLIELRAQVEIGGLDAVADAEKIFEVQTRALNEQILIQSDRVMLVQAAFQQLTDTQGANAAATQNMESRLNRETLALQKLQTQLQQLQSPLQQLQTSTTTAATAFDNAGKKFSDFFSSAFSGKITELTESFPLLSGFAEKATTALSGFAEKAVTALSAIPTPAKAAVLAIMAIPIAAKAAENAILSLADPAIKAGDAFYVASRGVQMSIADYSQLTTVCKVTGIEVDEVVRAMRRLNMQAVKSGDGAAIKTMQKFGVEIRNANGELKNAFELSVALAGGLERAQKLGKSKDFIAGVFGRLATGDLVTYLEDLKGNLELSRTIVKNGLFDPARAHNLQGLINAMNTQAEQLGSTFSTALIPVAERIVPSITKRMGELTQVIQDNAGGIKKLGEAFANLAEIGEAAITKIAEGGIKILGGIGNLFLGRENSFVEKYLNDKDIQSAEDLMKKHMQNYYSYQDRLAIENNPAMYQTTLNQFRDYFKAIEDARKTSVKSWADFKREEENSLKEAVKFTDEELEESKKRVEKIKEEIENLKIELYSGNDYEKSIAKLDLQFERADIENKPEDEQAVIKERYALNFEQITREFEEVEKSFNEKVLAINSTALEQKLANIEKEKQAWIQKGIEEVKATQWAEQAKAEAIKNVEQSFNDRVVQVTGSSIENRLLSIEREKQAWIDKGIDEVRATELSEQQKAKVIEDAEKNINNKEKQLDDAVERRNKLYKEREKIYEQFQEHAENTARQVQSIWQTELQQRLSQIEQERRAFIKQGVDKADAAKWAAQAEADAEKNAAMQILKTRLKAFRAYKQGGYEGLRQYELAQLAKQGISSDDLKMTPKLLHQFDVAQKAVQGSLLPKFMTGQDHANVNSARNKETRLDIPDVSVHMTDEWTDRLKENSKQIEKANEEIAKLSEEIFEGRNDLSEILANKNENQNQISQPVDEILQPDNQNSYAHLEVDGKPVDTEAYFRKHQSDQIEPPQEQPNLSGNLNSQIDTSIFDSVFEDLKTKLENFGSCFEGLTTKLSNITDAFSNLIEKVNNFKISQNNTPPQITNNVSIQEAHAWDYSHIKDLAEKVADVITPKILNALGGNSNGY